MNRNKKVTCVQHAGQVVKITPTQIEVSITVLSACSACHAKAFCTISDQKEKVINVPNIGQSLQVGDKVNVQMKQSLGAQAVVLAYLIPVIIVIISLLTFSSLKFSEPLSGLFSLSCLSIYYFILYLYRNKLKKVYNFQLVKIDQWAQ